MSELFEKIDCPICRSSDYTHFISTFDRFDPKKELNFEIVKCQRCEFVYLNPRPGEEEIGKYYKSDSYDPFISTGKSKNFRDKIYLLIRNINLQLKVAKINKLTKPGCLLDIGCATGEFLNAMKRRNWKTIGVETDDKARNFSIKKGFKVFDSLDNLDKNYKYDVISLWHVLEHIHKLQNSVDLIGKLMNKGGFLIMAVPNIKSSDFNKYRSNWIALDAPRHLYHFSPVSINRLLVPYGFKLVNSWPLIFDSFYNHLMSRNLKYSALRGWKSAAAGLLCGFLQMVLFSKCYSSSLVYCFVKEK
ncbi:MAG: class I SAM-dependent methyltransferase [Candidatus Marinimicrobia bacterium]|nr:class I SAM-dependent methyltransferase [Candidatus Neomarinimicrobiota bacterium]